MNRSDTYLAIRDLRVRYGDNLAVDGVDLSIGEGQTLCLLGPSGCGKTTILRSIAGLLVPESGTVTVAERDLLPIPIHKRDIGLVFQTWALFPHMTVADNVAYGLRMRRVPRPEQQARVAEALATVRLSQFAGRKPAQLSGGQQQRVALARAIVTKPRLLLLDEPLSSLDLKIRVELRRELRRIQRSLGLTAVYVTHDHSEALALGDRVAVMGVGKVIEEGPPEELFTAPRTDYVTDFLGFDNILPGTVQGSDGQHVVMSVGDRLVRVRRPSGSGSDVRFQSVALTPWAVTPVQRREPGEDRGRVVSLDQQSGRILVSLQVENLGVLNGFAAEGQVPAIGDEVSVRIKWSEGRALESVTAEKEVG